MYFKIVKSVLFSGLFLGYMESTRANYVTRGPSSYYNWSGNELECIKV